MTFFVPDDLIWQDRQLILFQYNPMKAVSIPIKEYMEETIND